MVHARQAQRLLRRLRCQGVARCKSMQAPPAAHRALPRHPCPTAAAGVKLSVFDGAKKALAKAEAAYDAECVRRGLPPPKREEWLGRGRGGAGAKAAVPAGGKQQRK